MDLEDERSENSQKLIGFCLPENTKLLKFAKCYQLSYLH